MKNRLTTLVIFFGDNGTANGRANRATIGGRPLSGAKGSMLEGGGLVPMVVGAPRPPAILPSGSTAPGPLSGAPRPGRGDVQPLGP